jgi:O-methyltransferase
MSRLSRLLRKRRLDGRVRLPVESSSPSQPLSPSYHPRTRWWRDAEWLAQYDRFVLPDNFTGGHHHRILDRRFTIQQLASSVKSLSGSTAECGVFKGVSSAMICAALQGTYGNNEHHYGFDSFEGLPEPGPNDPYWVAGKLATPYEATRSFLAAFEFCELRVGWMPDTFAGLENQRFRLVHIDVDIEESTRHCLEFFYQRAVSGAVFVFDDYGFVSCEGARRAIQQFMQDKPETVVELTTGQGFFYRH